LKTPLKSLSAELRALPAVAKHPLLLMMIASMAPLAHKKTAHLRLGLRLRLGLLLPGTKGVVVPACCA
jgi:hypothetical protein